MKGLLFLILLVLLLGGPLTLLLLGAVGVGLAWAVYALVDGLLEAITSVPLYCWAAVAVVLLWIAHKTATPPARPEEPKQLLLPIERRP